MTDPQHARWLELVEARAYRKHDNSFEMTETEAFALCAAITRDAVEAERERLAKFFADQFNAQVTQRKKP